MQVQDHYTKFLWPKRLLLMALIAPLVLIWGEIFTRMLLPQNLDSRMNIFAPDPVIGFTYMPNAKTYEKGREYNALYQINSVGLRDREYGPKREGVFRGLLVGDSFSASHGLPIEESLSRQLERALQAAIDLQGLSVKVEIVNAASGGYSPYNYWKAYRRWAAVFKPDVVIVGLSPDDFDCTNENSQYVIKAGEIMGILKRGQEHTNWARNSSKMLRKWLSSSSQLYILMRNYFYYNDLVGLLSLSVAAKDMKQVEQLQQYIVPQPQSMEAAWQKTFSYIDLLFRETANDGVGMVVIPIPLKSEVDRKEYEHALASSGLNPEQIDINQPLNEISAFCRGRNIPLLDPRRALRERNEQVPCYFIYDGHWVAEGIRVASASIAKQWFERGLFPFKKVGPELSTKASEQ